jgi:DNA-directed RNA polymerase specialized sigma24 family protein
VVAAIAVMPKKYRSGAVPDVVKELSYQEITDRVACPVKRVRVRPYHRRRRRQKALSMMAAKQGVITGLGPTKESYGANRSVYL